MLDFDLSKLKVFHVQIPKSAAKGQVKLGDFLKGLRSVSKAFAPETCARHVYVCHKDLMGDISDRRWYIPLKQHALTFEELEGVDAYAFLLKWSIGLISKKFNNNDQFVKGQLRKAWTRHLKSNEDAKPLEPLVRRWFEDTRELRAGMISGLYPKQKTLELRNQQLHHICNVCAVLRGDGLKPVYKLLTLPVDKALKSTQENQLEMLTNKIAELKLKLDKKKKVKTDFEGEMVETENLVPSFSRSKQKQAFGQLEALISSNHQARQIRSSLNNA